MALRERFTIKYPNDVASKENSNIFTKKVCHSATKNALKSIKKEKGGLQDVTNISHQKDKLLFVEPKSKKQLVYHDSNLKQQTGSSKKGNRKNECLKLKSPSVKGLSPDVKVSDKLESIVNPNVDSCVKIDECSSCTNSKYNDPFDSLNWPDELSLLKMIDCICLNSDPKASENPEIDIDKWYKDTYSSLSPTLLTLPDNEMFLPKIHEDEKSFHLEVLPASPVWDTLLSDSD